jgi:hypothetical protein
MSILLMLACNGDNPDSPLTSDDTGGEPCGISTWYYDADRDGWPVEDETVEACEAPDGYAAEAVAWDCDDADAAVHPEAGETCNEIDDDCDGDVDEEDTDLPAEELSTFYADGDGDGYGNPDSTVVRCVQPSGYTDEGTDCDDDLAEANPGATEICEDGIDNDCDGTGNECGWAETITGPALTLSGDGEDEFGASLALADGALVVGAPSRDGVGGVYVFPDSATGSLSAEDADLEILGDSPGDKVGARVVELGDVDGDFAPEVLIAAPGDDGGGSDAGAVYLAELNFIGHQTTSDLGAAWFGTGGQNRLGTALAALGDLDGDSLDDMAIGAPGHGTGSDRRGAVYVVHGPLTGFQGIEGTSVRLRGHSDGGSAGSAVSRAGDLDGDGFRELLVGAPARDENGSKSGAAYVVLGPASASGELPELAHTLAGPTNAALAGTAVLGTGDMNGDGYGEVLVGAPGVDVDGMLDAGAVYLVYGPVTGDLTLGEQTQVLGSAEDMELGSVLGSAGASSSLMLGSPSTSTAWLQLGPVSGTLSVDELEHSVPGGAGEGTGCAITAGSVDIDPYLDLVVGSCEAGRVDVFLGTGL